MLLADDMSTGTGLGIISLAIITIGGAIQLWLKIRYDFDKAIQAKELKLANDKLAMLEAGDIECKRQIAAHTAQIIELKIAGSNGRMTGFYVYIDMTDELIIDATDGVKAMLGWRAIDLKGQRIDVLIPPENHKRHHDGVAAVMRGDKPPRVGFAIITQALKKDGGRIAVTVAIRPVPERGPTVYRAEVREMGGIAE